MVNTSMSCYAWYLRDWTFCLSFMRFFGSFSIDTDGQQDPASRNNYDRMGFGHTTSWMLLFLPHLLLQLSGLTFQLPPKRHPEGNRIWNEYRWHALAFCCRSLTYIMFLSSVSSSSRQQDSSYYYYNDILLYSAVLQRIICLSVLLINMYCVDCITNYYKRRKESSSTIRHLKGPPMMKYFMSVTQFHVNVNCLLFTQSAINVQFAALMVVQSSAFGMTLRRKCVITHFEGLCLYSLILVIGMYVILDNLHEHHFLAPGIAIGNIAAMLRIDMRFNKYLLWSMVSFGFLPIVEVSFNENNTVWNITCLFSTVGLFLNGYRHQMRHVKSKHI